MDNRTYAGDDGQWKHQTIEEARQQYQKLNNKLCKVTQSAKEL